MIIELERLDSIVTEKKIGLMKIDVEGHELQLLRGASGLLESGAIRDIVYEDHQAQPNEVSNYLRSFGYEILKLQKTLLKPRLHPFDALLRLPSWHTPNYIATLDIARVRKKFMSWGWRCFRLGPK